MNAHSWAGWNKPIGSVSEILTSVTIKVMSGQNEALAGQEGNIWIKGLNIFKGYYKSPRQLLTQSVKMAGSIAATLAISSGTTTSTSRIALKS